MSEPKWTSTTTWADLGPDDLPRHHPAHIEVDDKPQQTTAAETELQRILKALEAAEPDIETLKRENADLTRRLAEVTAERDEWKAYAKTNQRQRDSLMTRAETAEAALSARDEALRVAKEALVDTHLHGYDRWKIIPAIAKIVALTKSQEAADAGENG